MAVLYSQSSGSKMRSSVGTRPRFDELQPEASSVDDAPPASIVKVKRGLGFQNAADYEDNLAKPDDFMASTFRMTGPAAITPGCWQGREARQWYRVVAADASYLHFVGSTEVASCRCCRRSVLGLRWKYQRDGIVSLLPTIRSYGHCAERGSCFGQRIYVT